MHASEGEVTRLLKAWCKGDASALERPAPVVEHELREIAHAYLSREASGHTLQSTALINEAYLRLLERNTVDWQDRTPFLAVAAKMMRRILVNHAVARRRKKRGGAAISVSLAEADGYAGPERRQLDECKSRMVELRYFGGLTRPKNAPKFLGVSLRTVHREWDLARAWLFRALRG